MSTGTKTEKKLVTSPLFTMDFPSILAPRIDKKNGEDKGYDMTMIFKDVDLKGLIALMRETAAAKWGANIPKNIQWPLRKPDAARLEKFPHYEGCVFASAKSKFKPMVIDGAKKEITDPKMIYSGAKGFARLGAYAWEYMGKNGVSFNLYAVQKSGDGEKLVKQADHSEFFEQLQDAGQDLGFDDLSGELSFEENDASDIPF